MHLNFTASLIQISAQNIQIGTGIAQMNEIWTKNTYLCRIPFTERCLNDSSDIAQFGLNEFKAPLGAWKGRTFSSMRYLYCDDFQCCVNICLVCPVLNGIILSKFTCLFYRTILYLDSKVHGANMGPIWDWQDPGGPMLAPWTLLSGYVSTALYRLAPYSGILAFWLIWFAYHTTLSKALYYVILSYKSSTSLTFVKSAFENHWTHWGLVTHMCFSKLSIIGSDNGLSPGRCQAII